MSGRAPSLRELRRSKPENIVILPTAAPRMVQQNYNRAATAARRDLARSSPWPGEYKSPWHREADRRAEVLGSIQPTPELMILDAILSSMSREQREIVIRKLMVRYAATGHEMAIRALEYAKLSVITYGDSVDLARAFERKNDDGPCG